MTPSRHPSLTARRKARAQPVLATLHGFLCFVTVIAFAVLAVLIMAAC